MTNEVTISGMINNSINEEIVNEQTNLKKYSFELISERTSKIQDIIPVIFYSVNPISINPINPITIHGYIHSTNVKVNNKSKLLLAVIAKEINEGIDNPDKRNRVVLEGYITKQPIYRETPLGRQITDLLIAYNHNNKSSYIPTIVWGRNAKFISTKPVGTRVKLEGRFQSRKYTKLIDNVEEERIAYEFSVANILETEVPNQE